MKTYTIGGSKKVKNSALLKRLAEISKRICEELRRVPLVTIPHFYSSLKPPKRTKSALTLIALMLITVTVSSLMTTQVLSAGQTSKTLSNTGNIGTLQAVGVEIYTDASLTRKATSISWGTLSPGTQRTFSIYIRNEGNTLITLRQSVSDWNPSNAAAYMTLTWNYAGQTLGIGQGMQITLTLTVSTSISGINDFSFDIIIVGTS
jgi:hypothetical protein